MRKVTVNDGRIMALWCRDVTVTPDSLPGQPLAAPEPWPDFSGVSLAETPYGLGDDAARILPYPHFRFIRAIIQENRDRVITFRATATTWTITYHRVLDSFPLDSGKRIPIADRPKRLR